MTQTQLDCQFQLEQNNTDLTTQSFFNDSPVLFLGSMDQTNTNLSEQDNQAEHHNNYPNNSTPPTKFTVDQSHETPPPSKKKHEIKKRSCVSFFTGILAFITNRPSLPTTRDDHLIPILSNDHFTFKAHLTSLYMHPTDYT